MKPLTSERNLTPSSTAPVSDALGSPGVAVLGQIVHGQPSRPPLAAVVNGHTYVGGQRVARLVLQARVGRPAVQRHRVGARRGSARLLGVSVAVRVAAFQLHRCGHQRVRARRVARRCSRSPSPASSASLKVAVTAARHVGTFVAPLAGDWSPSPSAVVVSGPTLVREHHVHPVVARLAGGIAGKLLVEP